MTCVRALTAVSESERPRRAARGRRSGGDRQAAAAARRRRPTSASSRRRSRTRSPRPHRGAVTVIERPALSSPRISMAPGWSSQPRRRRSTGEVADAAEGRRVFVNAVDDPANASAFLSGVVRRDGVTLAISTSGAAPALTALLREGLDAVLPQDLAIVDVARRAPHASPGAARACRWRLASRSCCRR